MIKTGSAHYRLVIVLSGQILSDDGLLKLLDKQDVLICADGGARHLRRINRVPDLLVGDLDSIETADLAWLQASHVTIERYPSVKNETDAELAVVSALHRLTQNVAGESPVQIPPEKIEIVFLGALGGRPDHVLANQLMAVQLAEQKFHVLLSDGLSYLYPLVGPDRLEINLANFLPDYTQKNIPTAIPYAVSAVPISPKITGLTYTGLKYPLVNATLPRGSCRAVSNRPVGEVPISIILESGALLVIVTPEV
ncbi:MAG: thiamine diphosphokinase [Eubacteriales bacterium]|nr:thiamine diphosphokinase [Eubacteriales bacterium]